MHLMHETPVEQGMDTCLLHGTGCTFCLGVFWLEVSSGSGRLRGLRLLKIEKSSASEDVFGRRGLRLLKTEIGTILANGVDQVGILGFRLRSLSSIRFERYSPSLSSSTDLRLHRTFV
ncbi:hypothetical protein L6452_03775 [Arctium lappa]|uniref:Uncharacterized protein n=1 Tax=Arctium lappa TaxID=4217 RepID=A0ACB9FP71_ARCLA|nr:hypothetical protein L6452_03775 [Arctium lappa]